MKREKERESDCTREIKAHDCYNSVCDCKNWFFFRKLLFQNHVVLYIWFYTFLSLVLQKIFQLRKILFLFIQLKIYSLNNN